MKEYIFKEGRVINVIQCKPSANKKLGINNMIIQTYHFSEDQLTDFRNDKDNCLDCPYSFNQNGGKSGKCYTHKGMQLLGLKSMLKRLSKMPIPTFSQDNFDKFTTYVSSYTVELTRLGAYGEPTLLPIQVLDRITSLAKGHTGYTHQWGKPEVKDYSKYLMASTHNKFETSAANSLGFRAFQSADVQDTKMAICPASKEFTGKKKTCVECTACNGTKNGRKNNLFIQKH